MLVIPAIDLKNGKCVRLLQGRKDAETVFSDNPVAVAQQWVEQGAELIHIIDLDGAFEKHPVNLSVIKQIRDAVEIPLQVGGGIRNEETIKTYLDAGMQKTIIGTEAINNPALVTTACRTYPGQIVIGIDARNGLVATEGWTRTTRVKALDLARQYEDSGAAAINFTDIHRDGMQTGPNIDETRKLAEAVSIPVVASGGVSSLDDIRNLMPLAAVGVAGVITGKALYTGALNLREAVSLVKTAA